MSETLSPLRRAKTPSLRFPNARENLKEGVFCQAMLGPYLPLSAFAKGKASTRLPVYPSPRLSVSRISVASNNPPQLFSLGRNPFVELRLGDLGYLLSL